MKRARSCSRSHVQRRARARVDECLIRAATLNGITMLTFTPLMYVTADVAKIGG
jgi:hypothetical protein